MCPAYQPFFCLYFIVATVTVAHEISLETIEKIHCGITGPCFRILVEDDRNTVVLTTPEKSHNMWLSRSGEHGLPTIILYGYSPTRSGSHAKEFLEGNHGYLETDGYQGYNGLPDIKSNRLPVRLFHRREGGCFLMLHTLHFLLKPPYGSADMAACCAVEEISFTDHVQDVKAIYHE